jgi:hypothetical protein
MIEAGLDRLPELPGLLHLGDIRAALADAYRVMRGVEKNMPPKLAFEGP